MSDTPAPPAAPDSATAPLVLVTDRGAVRILTLNRPDKMNALNTALTTALRDELLTADADPAVRAIVLTGAGRAFCAGADLKEFSDLVPGQSHRVAARAELTSAVQALPSQIGKPTISAVHGAAIGGGAGLAIGCDMVIAGDDSTFGYPEIKHSIVPALVMTGLQRHLGRKKAFEMISVGALIGADEMLAHGLANEVVPADRALARAIEIAEQWATRTPAALRAIKSLFYRVADLPFDAAMAAGRDTNQLMRGFREQA